MITHEMLARSVAARDTHLQTDPNDQLGALAAALEAAFGGMAGAWPAMRPIAEASHDRTILVFEPKNNVGWQIWHWNNDEFRKNPRPHWTSTSSMSATWHRQHQPTQFIELPPILPYWTSTSYPPFELHGTAKNG